MNIKKPMPPKTKVIKEGCKPPDAQEYSDRGQVEGQTPILLGFAAALSILYFIFLAAYAYGRNAADNDCINAQQSHQRESNE